MEESQAHNFSILLILSSKLTEIYRLLKNKCSVQSQDTKYCFLMTLKNIWILSKQTLSSEPRSKNGSVYTKNSNKDTDLTKLTVHLSKN